MTLRISPVELVRQAEASGRAGLVASAPDWDRVRLGDVATVVNGAAFKSEYFNLDGVGHPLIRIRDVGKNAVSTWYSGPWESQHLVAPGDLLVGMDGEFRSARWTGQVGVLNQRVCKVSVTDPSRYDARFLELALPGYLEMIWNATSATTVKHLSSRSVADIPLPLPALSEQRHIVDLSEDHLSRLDAAATLLTSVSQRRLRAAAFAKLMRSAIAANVSGFELGDLAQVGTGTTPSRSEPAYYSGGDVPWVTSGDLSQGMITTARQFVTRRALDETSLRLYPAGTLLLAMYGEGKTRGTVGELGFEACINQACAAIRLHDVGLRAWTRAVLEANYVAMRRLAAGGVQPNLNLSVVRQISIPVPSASVRHTLISELDSVLGAQRRLEQQVLQMEPRVSALRRGVLTAALSGRLTGRSSDTEEIEELADA